VRGLAGEVARCLDARSFKFPNSLFPLMRNVSAERPGAVKGAPFRRGARGPLTAPGRSETVYEEGKEELQLDSISEAQQAKRLRVATIVLSETRGL